MDDSEAKHETTELMSRQREKKKSDVPDGRCCPVCASVLSEEDINDHVQNEKQRMEVLIAVPDPKSARFLRSKVRDSPAKARSHGSAGSPLPGSHRLDIVSFSSLDSLKVCNKKLKTEKKN